jgi:hypothetical protein
MRLSYFAAGILSRGKQRRGNIAALTLAALPLMAVAVALFSATLNTSAVQNPRISLDMVTAGNAYDDTTNSMTVGPVDNCVTAATGNPATHTRSSHLVVEDVEDLVAYQVRLNYVGDRMRPLSFNPTPFTDNNLGQPVGFLNLPIDQTSGVHRDVTPAVAIPSAPPDGTNTPQTAIFGATYNGTQSAPISPDAPAKATPDDSSYSTAGGGVIGALVLQVVGDESGQPSLFMNLDDNNPNAPGSAVVVFNGSGTTTLNLDSSALGDGYYGNGATCAPLDCVNAECPQIAPSVTPTPQTPTPTATRSPTPSASPTPSPEPTASPSPTPTPAPAGFRDARASKLSGLPKRVRLAPGQVVADSHSVSIANDSDSAATIGVYVDASTAGVGGCTPNGRVLNTTVTLNAGAKTTINFPVSYSCADPAAADGLVYAWVAVADVHADDASSCGPGSLQSLSCFNALASDDADPADNRVSRNAPRVEAQ